MPDIRYSWLSLEYNRFGWATRMGHSPPTHYNNIQDEYMDMNVCMNAQYTVYISQLQIRYQINLQCVYMCVRMYACTVYKVMYECMYVVMFNVLTEMYMYTSM